MTGEDLKYPYSGDKKKIYILLTDTGTLFTRTIRLYTRVPYNHVSIALDVSLEELYSFGRKKPNNPIHGGFVREGIRHGTFAKFKNTSYCLYCFEIDSKTYEKVIQAIDEFKRNRYKYNIIGLLGVMAKKPIERKNAFFCSQFVATVLKKSGINFFNKPPELVTPSDFMNSDKLEFVCQGKLQEYAPQLYENIL